MKDAGQYLEPAYLYADGSSIENLAELSATVKKYNCRNAIVHLGDVEGLEFEHELSIDRIKPVIDFPYGRGGVDVKDLEAEKAYGLGCVGMDVCVSLWAVLDGGFGIVEDEFNAVGRCCESEIKAIIQLPFLWVYAKDAIEPLLDVLVDAEVAVVKDWTTVMNFSKPVDVSLPARLAYLDYVRNLIDKKKLPLLVKIAGGVRADNAAEFFKHGADILGLGVPHVEGVYNALSKI